jgi:hypothetical protein
MIQRKGWQAEYMRRAPAWIELALVEKEGSRAVLSEKTPYPRNPSLRQTYAIQLLTCTVTVFKRSSSVDLLASLSLPRGNARVRLPHVKRPFSSLQVTLECLSIAKLAIHSLSRTTHMWYQLQWDNNTYTYELATPWIMTVRVEQKVLIKKWTIQWRWNEIFGTKL